MKRMIDRSGSKVHGSIGSNTKAENDYTSIFPGTSPQLYILLDSYVDGLKVEDSKGHHGSSID